MEIPKLIKYFEKIVEVKDACLKDQCILECDSMNVLRVVDYSVKHCSKNLGIDKDLDYKTNDFIDLN
ncbi:MAG: hypothetical protein M3Z01_05410 [Thermoproteota archaeon]|nr:hypothetical protein [Thermoproteota archaeon]